jgi:hypothetical protein
MVACEASGARKHGHDSKQEHQVEGPIMEAKEWTRAFGRCKKWSTQAQKSQTGDDRAGRKNRARRARATPGRPTCPINGTPGARLLQASSSLLPLFVCSSFCAQNHRRYSHPFWAWLLKQFTPLIHSKSTFRSNFWSA